MIPYLKKKRLMSTIHFRKWWFISLPENKILDLSKFKAFADDDIMAAQIIAIIFDGTENIVG